MSASVKQSLMAPLRWVANRLRNRPDSEHEMSFNRLVFAVIIVVVLLARWKDSALIGMAVYIFLAMAVLGHILLYPRICRARRLFALFLDCSFLSWQLHIGGEQVAIFYPIYLWVIFGNGFRFGLTFLAIAVPVATLSFGLVVATTPFWSRQMHLSDGLLVGLVILPAYAGTLIRKLSLATQTAEEASKAKSLFLASVSHELRTPLTAIVGMSGLLRSTRVNDDQREMIETIDVATRSLQSLINGLLDLSRIEAGRMPNVAEEFELATLLVDVRRMVETEVKAKGLSFDIHVTPRTPWRLLASRQHLHEILVNLAGNAVKFTEAGGVVVAVDGQLAEDSDAHIVLKIEVSDTGIGIAPQDQTRIFENFTQANDTILNRFGGTGLGLAITKQLVGLMGGTIDVESALGAGTIFRISLRTGLATSDAYEPSVLNNPEVTLIINNPVVLAETQAQLHSIGAVAILYDPSCQDAGVSGSDEVSRILLVDKPDWSDANELCSRMPLPPTVILLDKTAALTLPDIAIRKRCVSILSEPLSDTSLRRLLSFALHLSGRTAIPETFPALDALKTPNAAPSRRVLLVDDNRINQRVFSRILESAGHEVLIAENGEIALDILEREAERLDIVLMDFNMPELDGLEATKLFRIMSTGDTRLPIIGLTADAAADADSRWRDADMDGCLIKPVALPTLLATINSMARTASSVFAKPIVIPSQISRPTKPMIPALDQSIINNLRQLGDDAFIDELMSDFMSDAKDLIDTLKATARRGDTQAFRSHAHALRSSSANVGAVALGELCAPWVGQRGSELQTKATAFAEQAQDELSRTREALASLKSASRELRV